MPCVISKINRGKEKLIQMCKLFGQEQVKILEGSFLKYAEYIPQEIIAPTINKSPLLKFKVSKIFRSSLVIIAKIPKTEISNPDI